MRGLLIMKSMNGVILMDDRQKKIIYHVIALAILAVLVLIALNNTSRFNVLPEEDMSGLYNMLILN